MFKIEYLSRGNFFFRVRVFCVSIEIPLRLNPAPTFRALKIYERSDVTIVYKEWLDQ